MPSWSEQIEEDLNWREAELASLKKEVLLSQPGSVKETSLLRALLALLYAHYEGFFKFVWALYLESIEKSGLKRSEVKVQIARLSLEKEFKVFRSKLDDETIWVFASSMFKELLNEDIRFCKDTIELKSECNLYPGNLCEYCDQILFSHQKVDEYSTILKSLVARRNDIAHGKRMLIKNLAEYHQFEEAGYLVMHEIGVLVVDAIEKEQYKLNIYDYSI